MIEMRSLQAAAKDLDALGVTVLGVSRDSVASQAAFHKLAKLTFDLLSDSDGAMVASYGAARKAGPFPKRHSILIDQDGVVRHIWRQVDIRKHGEQVLATARQLKQAGEAD